MEERQVDGAAGGRGGVFGVPVRRVRVWAAWLVALFFFSPSSSVPTLLLGDKEKNGFLLATFCLFLERCFFFILCHNDKTPFRFQNKKS